MTSITAGVIQGSVLGPTLFNITSSTLVPVSSQNTYYKYADDGYLIVPGNNANTIPAELTHHSKWAKEHNLKLNLAKTSEIVFTSKRKIATPIPPTNPGIQRVSSLKVLGVVVVDNKLTFQDHINETIKQCSQALLPSESYVTMDFLMQLYI